MPLPTSPPTAPSTATARRAAFNRLAVKCGYGDALVVGTGVSRRATSSRWRRVARTASATRSASVSRCSRFGASRTDPRQPELPPHRPTTAASVSDVRQRGAGAVIRSPRTPPPPRCSTCNGSSPGWVSSSTSPATDAIARSGGQTAMVINSPTASWTPTASWSRGPLRTRTLCRTAAGSSRARGLAGPVPQELAVGVPLLRFANGAPAMSLLAAILNPPVPRGSGSPAMSATSSGRRWWSRTRYWVPLRCVGCTGHHVRNFARGLLDDPHPLRTGVELAMAGRAQPGVPGLVDPRTTRSVPASSSASASCRTAADACIAEDDVNCDKHGGEGSAGATVAATRTNSAGAGAVGAGRTASAGDGPEDGPGGQSERSSTR